jgi:exopolyphosphatase/guanosine-5'-triphosphate,3'-diphosphate pyrophosphatase
MHIAQTNHPIKIIHRYAVRGSQVREFAGLIARQSPSSLATLNGKLPRRAELLPTAALVLERVLEIMRPDDVVFSAYGLREGLHFARLPQALRAADPLLEGCRQIAERMARFPRLGDEVADWIQPLFADETTAETHLHVAACLLGDLAWRVHPDHRAEHAASEVLRLPDLALDHGERAFVALAMVGRYTSKEAPGLARKIERLLRSDQVKRARGLGFAIRLAHTLSGAVPGLLRRYRLAREGGTLVLAAREPRSRLIGEIVERRFEALADQLDLKPMIVRAET